MEGINVIDDEDKPNTALPGILSDALAVSLDNHIGHDYSDDVESRYEYYHRAEEVMPCDLTKLNEAMKGGVHKKTLNVILAGVNTGKSLALCHLGASYLKQHKNVLYITMEMAEEKIAERIDANMLRTPVNSLESMEKDEYLGKFKRVTDTIKGKLVIKEYPTSGASAATFKALLKELQIKKKFKPDVIMIDYLGICASSRFSGSSENSYHYIKSIAEEIRALAIEHDVPVWTAAQVNRGAFNDSDPDMTATAESFGLPAVADMMLALVATEELQAMGQLKISIIKNRYSDYKRSFMVNVDYPRMTLSNVSEDVQLSAPVKADITKKPQFGKTKGEKKFGGIKVN
jgi:replicative DNA helicase